jgi:hypothetical protein
MKINKRFLMMINKADEQYKLESFKDVRIYPSAMHLLEKCPESKENERAMKLMGGDKPGLFLQKTNSDMYRILKKIILLLENNKQRIKDTIYKKISENIKNVISTFYDIYIQNTGLDSDKIKVFLEKNKNATLADLHSLITIGIPNIFYVSGKNINTLINEKCQLIEYLGHLRRDYGDI